MARKANRSGGMPAMMMLLDGKRIKRTGGSCLV
jgi:hypothetical protein